MTDYQTLQWQDAPSTATPIDAQSLNRMEQGIAAAHVELHAHEGKTTDVHGATITATPGRMVRRDTQGRANVTTPPTDAPADTVATVGFVRSAMASPGRKVFPVWWVGDAWEFTSLTAAQAAGYRDGDTIWFIGNPNAPGPSWAPSARSTYSQGG